VVERRGDSEQILGLEVLERVEGQNRTKVMWCGDFNAHNTLLGGKRIDGNGQVMGTSDRNERSSVPE
jgi:hypothetical protein